MPSDLLPDDLDFGQTIQIPRFGVGQKIFRRYILQKILGRGDMGVVWLAQDQNLENLVALKVLPETLCHDHASVEALKRETRLGLHLAHPNIVQIYDFQRDDNAAAISMEYVDGATFSEVRTTKPTHVFDPADLHIYIEPLCDALNYAHTRERIVHRDIKPRNLMLNSQGELKIADFGISRSISESMIMLTGKLGSAGSPPYISPQQWDGEPPTPLDDIYSVGATLYELLSSKPPFIGVVDWRQVHHKVPPSISKRRADLGINGAAPIPTEWEETIAACLAKNPKDRPQTVRDLQARLTINGQMPVATAETRAAPAVSSSPTVATTVDSSEEDFYDVVTVKDLPDDTVDTATVRAGPKLDATTAPVEGSSAPASEPILSELGGAVQDELAPQHVSEAISKIAEPTADIEAPATRIIAEPAPPLEPPVRPTDSIDVLPQEQAAPTNGDVAYPSIAIESPDRPDVIRPRLGKVPRWAWVAVAAILIVGAILIWILTHPGTTPSTFADLLIESEPSGADLTLDGGSFKTPHTFKDLKFGSHRLTMTLDGYSPIERDIEFSGASLPKIVLEPSAKPPEQIAKLSVRSDPPGASIRLDGTLPQEPNTFRNVKFGEHRLTATMEGFEPKEQLLVVSKDTSSEIILKLPLLRDPLQPLFDELKNSEAAYDWKTYQVVSLRLIDQLTSPGGPASNKNREKLTEVFDKLLTEGRKRNKERAARVSVKSLLLTSEEFRAHEKNLKSAAQLDIVPAILIAADELRERKPTILGKVVQGDPEALNWYYYAAEKKNNTYAMTRIGWIYWWGECGQQVDKKQAFEWFKRASDAGDAEASTMVGESYLRGMGTPKDEDEGIRRLLPLTEKGWARAKNLIGQCYYNGLGQFGKLSQDERNRKAKSLYEEAILADDWEACGHLGVMYEAGQGVPKDWRQAARLYLQGVEHENPICMYYYAQALENHGPELLKMLGREDDAETYYVKAAAAGVMEARQWCLEHKVKWSNPTPTPTPTATPLSP